jgi:sulfatase modifying factor 1
MNSQAKKKFFSGLFGSLPSSLLCLFVLPMSAWAQVTFEQKSDPAGLFTSTSATKNLNDVISTITPSLSTGGYSFTHWTVNGVRENAPDGQAKNKISATITENMVAIAHYLATNQDSDSDGVPDWFEIRMFATLDHNGSYDGDGDGVTLADERQFGLAATIADDFLEGGASIRRSGQVFANFGGAKKLSVSSDPAGLLTSSETFPETNSSYSSPNKNGLTSGYYFSHWEVNGVRQADTSGIGLSQISFTMTEDKTVVAKYYAENTDTDSDGLPDWYEWREFGNLDNNGTSDPDGDGFAMDAERQFGLSAVIGDEIMEGGASIRRSGQVFANFGGAKKLSVSSDPAGLLTSSETFPETNSSYTSPNKNGLTSGYYFSHWEVNGVRQADTSGIGLSQISFTMTEDKTVVAKYYAENADTDSDGLPDWYEWREFGNLDNNGTSDPDGDGFSMDAERQFGLSAVIGDEIMEGGGSIRRSGTFGYIEFQPNEDDDGDGLTKAQELHYGTSDDNTDSDGDGFPDGEEVTAGSDPANADSVPNRPPRDLNSTAVLAFSENLPAGQVIGEFNATDPDGDAITYHFVNGENNNSLFTLDSNGTLKTATTFDYESNASSYTITIQAKDELNATTEGNFTVTLLDVYEPSRENHTIDLNATVDLEMIWVEPGTFMMGSPTSEVGRSNNEGLKSVNIPRGFFLGKYELTQAQYEAVMKGNTFGLSPNPSLRPNKPNFPVEKVSSNHTQTFLEVLNKKQKDSGSLTYRWKYVLPTEAQWEYACRAGTTTAFSWGDSINSQHANYNDNIGRPVNVGQYEPNHWGFYDMHGNIYEWVSDRRISASKASARGGSYKTNYSYTRSAHRSAHMPNLLSERIGIRLAYEYIPNRNPSNLSSSHSLVFQENQPSGTIIGEFNATDPDGDAITYHLVNGENNNSLFTLDTNGTLKTATTFDYESNASTYTITVQAKDELNATTEGNFTVTLLDVFEDTDGDGFRDSLEASTGSNLNDPTSTPLQQGLVAWYPFDGNASDMSGNGNHGTVNGATLGTDRHGVAGKAYSFDGVDDYITVNDDDSLDLGNRANGALTLTLWHNIRSTNYTGTTKGFLLGKFSRDGSPWTDYSLATNNNELTWGTGPSTAAGGDAEAWMPTEYSFGIGKWNLLTVIFDARSDKKKVFANGKLINQASTSVKNTANNSPLTIGAEYNRGYWSGSIDDIRIYNRALSADEVKLLYRAESPNHFVDSAKDLEMIWVEPGTFTMGQTGVTNAEPEHNVTLTKGFYLGKYEVTQSQYQAVMAGVSGDLNATPSNWHGYPNRPVEKVSWEDIQVFLTRLNEQQSENLPNGWAYVLPTEAQWEYACRAGTTTAYSWGDSISASDANWNHGNDANQTENVGQYSANPWGFFDMHGNVWEWTADAWGNYATGAQTDPFNVGTTGSSRVDRGGSWRDTGPNLRSAFRGSSTPSNRNIHIGFRVGLRDLNKAPADLNSTAVLAVLENLPAGQVIGEFNATDSDLNGTLRYQLVTGEGSEGNSLFTLTQGGVLKSNSTFNYEADKNKSIRVAVLDDKNASMEKSFLINILDMDEGTYPSEGAGTDADPLQIETLSHLSWLSHNSWAWTKSYILINDINASVTKDWAAGYGFNPIGNSTIKFMGKFNGNGKIIYGLTINRTFRGAVGLFGNARLANISNLGVKNGNVSGSTLVGGIVGNLQSSAVVNCFFDGNVSSPGEKLGGLVGMSSGNSLIRNCYTSGVVTGTSARIGGVLGQNFTESKVDKSYSIARVIGSSQSGPLVGLASGGTNIYSSFWDSAATGRAGGKTTAEMKTPETFVNAGWDFNQTGVWKMIRGVTYPKLAWETLENISPNELNSTAQIKFTENLPIGSEIGSFVATDLNYPSEVSFYISSTSPNNSLFTLDSNGTLKTATTFDYESNASSYTITIQAKDELNATTEGNFTVTLLDLNEPPYDLNSTTTLSIAENQPVGTIVGEFKAADPDHGDQLSYRLVKDRELIDNELFTLDENGTLSTASIFDYEKNQTFHIRVKVLDLVGLISKESFYISVLNVVEDNDGDGEEDHYDPDDDNDGFSDVDELAYGSDPRDANSVVNQPPSDLLMDGGEIAENQEIGNLVARFIGVDADEEDTLRYKLIAPENNSSLPFRLSPVGNLKTTRVLDYEMDDHNYTVLVRVIDDLNTSFQKEFMIRLTNVVEDMDGDEIEDFYDEDRDGDGYTNEDEVNEGTDPNNKFSYPNKPILQTGYGLLNEDGSIDLTGGTLEDGNGKITDFGFVLSSGISIDPKKSKVLWIRGVGEPESFKLRLTQSPYHPVLYIRAWAKNIAGYGIGPVRKVRIPEAPKPWWGDAQERPGGWKTSGWFGSFISYGKGWLYHARLGWLYSSPASESSVWLWKENLGWLWTKEDAWPYLWSHQSGGWLYLYPGKVEETPRFYDYSTESYR